jgi:hypothetical protein
MYYKLLLQNVLQLELDNQESAVEHGFGGNPSVPASDRVVSGPMDCQSFAASEATPLRNLQTSNSILYPTPFIPMTALIGV